MNVGGLVDWGVKTLALVDDPSRLAAAGDLRRSGCEAKLGWLEEFRAALAEWSACMAVIETTLDFRPVPWIDRRCGAGVGGKVARRRQGAPANCVRN